MDFKLLTGTEQNPLHPARFRAEKQRRKDVCLCVRTGVFLLFFIFFNSLKKEFH